MTFPEPTTHLHTIAAAIETRLRRAFPAPLFDIQLMPAVPSKAEFDRLTLRKPFLGIAWASLDPDKRSGRILTADGQWLVYVVVDNPDRRRRFLGDARGIGLFGMVTAAAHLLHGWTIPTITTVSVTSVESLTREDWGDDATAIAGIALSTPIVPDAGIAATGDLPDFLRLGAIWMLGETAGGASLVSLGDAS